MPPPLPKPESDPGAAEPSSSAHHPASSTPHPDRTGRKVSKKLHKKRRETPHHSFPMDLPERLKDMGNEGEREEDVLHPPGGGMYMNMNQSIFGMIAAAGSRVDFNARFEGEGESSEEEDDDAHDAHRHMAMTELRSPRRPDRTGERRGLGGLMAQSTVLRKPGSFRSQKTDDSGRSRGSAGSSSHRRKLSGSKLLQSVPGLAKLSSRMKTKSPKGKGLADLSEQQIHEEEEEDESELGPPEEFHDAPEPPEVSSIELLRAEGRLAPVMSRILEAKAEMAARPSFDLDRALSDKPRDETDVGETGPTELARTLAEIFEFDKPEEVIEEYPCWLLQHVLLQGYMYITARHIAFYAYLPKRAHELAKSGYLAKSGKRNPKYTRYWFRLKGDVLSYFKDSQDLYFPINQIDLRYCISAAIVEDDKDREKEPVRFTLNTPHRIYNFKADSLSSAKEWVKSLQRVIFRSHNDGDSVKISLPIENIIDVEHTQMLNTADTCKLRVIDNDETYAIDEYFFSFFSNGKEAINVIKILVEGSSSRSSGDDKQQSDSIEPSSGKTSTSGSRERATVLPKIRTGRLSEGVKATLSPISPTALHASPSPRASQDLPRPSFDGLRPFGRRSIEVSQLAFRQDSPRRSFSDGRRSLSKHRHTGQRETGQKPGSSDSYVQSVEEPSQASLSALVASSSDEPSASQILRGSDVFHSPTVKRSFSAPRAPDSDNAGKALLSRHPSSGLAKYSARHAATTGHVELTSGEKMDGAPTTPTLQHIGRMTGYPLQKANAFMGYTRRMSTLLATESMGYVEKVSGMWKGGKKHYVEPAELRTDEEDAEIDSEDRWASNERFRKHFALPDDETLQAAYFGYFMRLIPLYGKVYISDRHFCFRSLLPGTKTKLILPLKDIETIDKEKGFRFGYSGLVVVIRGHEELFFEFGKTDIRDDCCVTVIHHLEAARYLRESSILLNPEVDDAQFAAAEHDALQGARHLDRSDIFFEDEMLPRESSVLGGPPMLFDDAKASFLAFKPPSMRITCLTIGSRGDVQPYIALCKALKREGHRPKIVTHAEFQDWIESHGIEFGMVCGNPSELMQLCIENGTFSWSFLREANSKFRGWLDELLSSAWEACKHSDLLIESPSAMAGIHIAEALGIPYFRAFGMPWTRTRAYPHAFIQPGQKMGGAYNYVTYVMFENVFWKAMAHQVNKWRNHTLSLPNTNLEKLQMNKVPFLYFFSPTVVPPPLDFPDWIRVTGYWFLDEGGAEWEPPKALTDFIAKARKEEKKLVYVGFGSIIVPDPAKMTQEVIDAVLKADVRCILSKGWSDRLESMPSSSNSDGEKDNTNNKKKPEPTLPPEILQIKSAPHDWLFTKIDAAAHHGGAGTTGASLRAGIPTIVRPFFGDQYFSGSRVEDLGVGICLKKWGAMSFGRALWEATHSERMITKARVLGEQIRKENGVDTAIQFVYRDLEYAKSLIKTKTGKNAERRNSVAQGNTEELDDAEEEEIEEWTFVGGADEDDLVMNDPDAAARRAAATVVEADFKVVGGHGGGGHVHHSRGRSLGSKVMGPAALAAGASGSVMGTKKIAGASRR